MSSSQSAKSRSGKNLEEFVSLLTHYNIKFYRQSHDNIRGDFIIPKDGQYIILSTKTILRERWKEFVEEKCERVSKVYVLTMDKINPFIRKRLNMHDILIIEENISFKDFISYINDEHMNIIDLFCGAGGMSVGFEKAGFKSILGIDNNIQAIKTYQINRSEDTKVICDNIKVISADVVQNTISSKNINLIVGGPPCTAFSMAGNRDPNDIRASLFMDFIRMVNYFKPLH